MINVRQRNNGSVKEKRLPNSNLLSLVDAEEFESPTPSTSMRCSSQLSYASILDVLYQTDKKVAITEVVMYDKDKQ